jgi:hypothetical protein
MRMIRRPAVQGHDIPTTAHAPRGPFPQELLTPSPVVTIEEELPDPRANAQNHFQAPSLVRCRLCGEVMYSDETDMHGCGD